MCLWCAEAQLQSQTQVLGMRALTSIVLDDLQQLRRRAANHRLPQRTMLER